MVKTYFVSSFSKRQQFFSHLYKLLLMFLVLILTNALVDNNSSALARSTSLRSPSKSNLQQSPPSWLLLDKIDPSLIPGPLHPALNPSELMYTRRNPSHEVNPPSRPHKFPQYPESPDLPELSKELSNNKCDWCKELFNKLDQLFSEWSSEGDGGMINNVGHSDHSLDLNLMKGQITEQANM